MIKPLEEIGWGCGGVGREGSGDSKLTGSDVWAICTDIGD